MINLILYSLWIGIPLIFLLLLVWNKLEEMSGKKRSFHYHDMMSQLIFLCVCGAVSWLIDTYLLMPKIEIVTEFGLPKGLVRIGVYFLVLIAIGTIYGPSKTLRVGEEKVQLHKKKN